MPSSGPRGIPLAGKVPGGPLTAGWPGCGMGTPRVMPGGIITPGMLPV